MIVDCFYSTTFVEAFKAFVMTEDCPTFVRRQYIRAVDREVANLKLAYEADDIGLSDTPADSQDVAHDDVALAHRLLGEVVAAVPVGADQFQTGAPDHDWEKTLYNWPPPADLSTRLQCAVDNFYAGDHILTLGKHSPVLAVGNDQQVLLLTIVLLHLRAALDPASSNVDVPAVLRCIVQGIAGTGKSFCIRAIADFVRMLTLQVDAVQIGAPTGTAANNAGGSTLQRLLGFTSTSCYKPVGASRLPELQARCTSLFAFLVDKYSLIGRRLLGMCARRWGDLCHRGQYSDRPELLGKIPLLIFFGDALQLPPVLDTSVSDPRPSSVASESARILSDFGLSVWQQFDCAVELTQPVRQDAMSCFAQVFV
jgi:hypothetical protein